MTDHGYLEDQDGHVPGVEYPHTHRCVDCGGWIIRMGIDNTTCEWCVDGGRPRCEPCQRTFWNSIPFVEV